ncbi:Glycosyl transferase family 2 [compost metagenome]
MAIYDGEQVKINFIVVVYATPPALTVTLKSLGSIDFSKFRITQSLSIWDNSAEGFGKDAIPDINGGVSYYHNGRNERLSVVYNKIVADSEGSQYFIVLDDDSEITEEYICSLFGFFSSGIPVGIPRILFKRDLISPGMVQGVRGKQISNEHLRVGSKDSKDLVAMMSGTIIHRQVFDTGLRFDERLSFYGIDTKFFIDYAKRYSKIFILDAVLIHNSALRERGQTYESRVKRLKNLVLSRLYVFDHVSNFRLKILIYLFFFCMKTIVREKNIQYISLLGLFSKILKSQD